MRPSKNHFLKIAQPLRKMPCNFLVPSKNISPKLFGPWKINVSGHWPEGNVINVHPGSNFRGVPRFWWIYHMVCSMSNVEFFFTALGFLHREKFNSHIYRVVPKIVLWPWINFSRFRGMHHENSAKIFFYFGEAYF